MTEQSPRGLHLEPGNRVCILAVPRGYGTVVEVDLPSPPATQPGLITVLRDGGYEIPLAYTRDELELADER